MVSIEIAQAAAQFRASMLGGVQAFGSAHATKVAEMYIRESAEVLAMIHGRGNAVTAVWALAAAFEDRLEPMDWTAIPVTPDPESEFQLSLIGPAPKKPRSGWLRRLFGALP